MVRSHPRAWLSCCGHSCHEWPCAITCACDLVFARRSVPACYNTCSRTDSLPPPPPLPPPAPLLVPGRDFSAKSKGGGAGGAVDVSDQVQRLIEMATSHSNLSQLFTGWCPYW